MIQFNKSQTINTVAFYPEAPISASVSNVRFYYSQDINRNTGSFEGAVDSKLNWVITKVSGSDLPSPSGLYTLTVYELLAQALVWNITGEIWSLANVSWDSTTGETTGSFLATERAYISGSNESGLTVYLSPGQAGYYITYQD